MSKILTEVATHTEAVVVPVPGEGVTAASVEVFAQSLANRSRVLFELSRALNWGPGNAISANNYEPLAIGYDSGRTRRWYALHYEAGGSPANWEVSSSADGITTTAAAIAVGEFVSPMHNAIACTANTAPKTGW